MNETVEKIVCCDRGNNDLATAALLSRDRDNDWGPMMAMMGGGMNNWMNNPFAYMMMMAWMRNFNGDGWNGNGGLQAEIDSIRTQLSNNQNSTLLMDAIKGNNFALIQLSQNLNVDFNTLQKCCCDVQAAIQAVAGQVGFSAERVINATILGDKDILAKMCECCCQTQRQIADFRADAQLQICQKTNTLQRGQDFVNRSVERGFAAQGYKAEQDKCDIINAINAAQQRNADMMNNHWSQEQALEIQNLKNQLGQRDTVDAVVERLEGSGYGRSCGCRRSCGSSRF